MTAGCAELFTQVIQEDTGLDRHEAELLAVALAGMAQVTARYWLRTGCVVPRETADRSGGRSSPGAASGASPKNESRA